MVDDAEGVPNRDVLVVRALLPALDQLVPRLVQAHIAVRELTPVVSPLETAFLALTEQQESTESREPGQ
jgi:ABC-2 type transport system ATP-binding protein